MCGAEQHKEKPNLESLQIWSTNSVAVFEKTSDCRSNSCRDKNVKICVRGWIFL